MSMILAGPALVFGKFVTVDIIGSLNLFHMPIGKHYVASPLAVIVFPTRILIIEPTP